MNTQLRQLRATYDAVVQLADAGAERDEPLDDALRSRTWRATRRTKRT